jgi:acyl-CoA thioesterase I
MISLRELIIVALGDSTTAGTPGFRSPIEAPPSGSGDVESQYAHWLMRTHPEWTVLNRGVNGERTDQIRLRFDRDVLAANPDAVVIIAGVNDVYQGRPAAVVQRELEMLYDAARGAGIATVAGTILPYNTANEAAHLCRRAINAWIREYTAANPDVIYCDTCGAVAFPGRPDRLVSSPDDLHPSADGYRLMALALEPAIRAALLKR